MMKPQFQERHQDYVIDHTIDPRLASVAPGQLITNIELRTDPDAPFLLRGRAYRVKYDNLDSRTQVGLQNLFDRVLRPNCRFPLGRSNPSRASDALTAGSPGRRSRLSASLLPCGLDIAGGRAQHGHYHMDQFGVYFRGVKLYPWGTNPSYTYPEKCSLLPYVYPIETPTSTNLYGTIQCAGDGGYPAEHLAESTGYRLRASGDSGWAIVCAIRARSLPDVAG